MIEHHGQGDALAGRHPQVNASQRHEQPGQQCEPGFLAENGGGQAEGQGRPQIVDQTDLNDLNAVGRHLQGDIEGNVVSDEQDPAPDQISSRQASHGGQSGRPDRGDAQAERAG